MNSNLNILKFFFGYGLSVFPLLLLIGPLFSEIFLIFIIFFSIFLIIKEKKYDFFLNKYSLFFLIFYLSTVFSTIYNFYNFDNFDNLKGGIFYFRIPLFALSIWLVLDRFNLFNKKIILFYIVFFLVIIFDSLLQYYLGKNLLGYEIIKNRISSFFGDELVLGSFLVKVIPIFMIYLTMNGLVGNKIINITYVLIISLASLVIYISGERTSFGLLILFFFTLFFMVKFLRKFIFYLIIIFTALAIILPSLKSSNEIDPAKRMFKKSYYQIIGQGEERYEKHKKKLFNKVYIFSHDHHGHYVLSYQIFKDHMIFGTGVKGFRYLCRNKIYILENNDGCSTHPHNTYIQILVSNGLIGFTLLLISLLYFVREIFICKKSNDTQVVLNKYKVSKAIAISAVFVNLWPIIPSGNFFNNWLSMFYFYPVGFYLYFKNYNEKQIG